MREMAVEGGFGLAGFGRRHKAPFSQAMIGEIVEARQKQIALLLSLSQKSDRQREAARKHAGSVLDRANWKKAAPPRGGLIPARLQPP